MNNLKKYIPKRKYKERSQLESRKRLGFLEKKQDYKVRANDYAKKDKAYKKLIEKARTKNPDEFYFKMTKSKLINGEHYDVNGDNFSKEKIDKRLGFHQKILNLVNLKKSLLEKHTEKKELELNGLISLKSKASIDKKMNNETNDSNQENNYENLEDIDDNENDFNIDENLDIDENDENDLKLVENKGNNNKTNKFTHKIFFDSIDDIKNFEATKYFDSELINDPRNRLKNSQLENMKISKNIIQSQSDNIEKEKEIKELIKNKHKLNNLNKISMALEYQKNLIVPGKKRKIEGKDGLYNYRFFNERKK